MTRYIVLVYPPRPTRDTQTAQFYSQGSVSSYAPKVVRITARSVESALAEAKIPAGGYALIVEESKVKRFDRATKAPLIEREPDGNPWDAVTENAA